MVLRVLVIGGVLLLLVRWLSSKLGRWDARMVALVRRKGGMSLDELCRHLGAPGPVRRRARALVRQGIFRVEVPDEFDPNQPRDTQIRYWLTKRGRAF